MKAIPTRCLNCRRPIGYIITTNSVYDAVSDPIKELLEICTKIVCEPCFNAGYKDPLK